MQLSVSTAKRGVPGSNQALVGIRVTDDTGAPVARPFVVRFYLSDDPRGAGLAAVQPSDNTHLHAPGGGTQLQVIVPRLMLELMTGADGACTVAVNDKNGGAFYPCAVNPESGEVCVSARLEPENYGHKAR